MSSFGSGAGSDSFSFVVQDAIEAKVGLAPKVSDYINRKSMVSYVTYAKYKEKIWR